MSDAHDTALQQAISRIGQSDPLIKLLQEVITLAVFAPFAVLYMKQSLRLDHLWAALCLVGAVYFAFRGQR